ncbi:MAG: ATP-binding cassette domain-containing protein [Pseudomonadota bacterium]
MIGFGPTRKSVDISPTVEAGAETQSVWQTLRPGARLLLGVSFGINLLMLATPLYMMQLFDRVVVTGIVESLVALTIITLLAVVAMTALDGARGAILVRAGGWLDGALFSRLAADERMRRQGDQFLTDMSVLRSALSGRPAVMLLDAPWIPIFLVPLFILSPLFGLAALMVMGLLGGLAFGLERADAGDVLDARARLGASSRVFAALRFAGLGGVATPAIEARSAGVAVQSRSLERTAGAMAVAKGVRFGAQVVLLGMGAWLILADALSAGGLIAATVLFARAVAPFEQAVGGVRELLAAREAWSRVGPLGERSASDTQMVGASALTPCLDLSSVTVVDRPGGIARLADVSLAVSPGEVVGLMGTAGAGKSLLLDVVAGRRASDRGTVRFGGLPLDQVAPDPDRRFMGVLSETPQALAGTLADLIAGGEADTENSARMAAVVEAARLAGAHEMIGAFADGYQTRMSADRPSLSSGQLRLVHLAAAIYRRPHVLLLDAPTAFLDGTAQAGLVRALKAARGWGALTLVGSSDPRLIGLYDRVAVLAVGRIQYLGAPDRLMDQVNRPASVANRKAEVAA